MRTLITLAGVAFFVAATPVSAGSEVEVGFRYHEAELATPDAAQALFERIELHSRRNCANPSRTVWEIRMEHECARNLVQQYVAAIDSPLLTAIARAEHDGVRIASR
ncbi:UrcA family protein [Alteraurantiacibacter aquimixticola]|uniref:UrcA family protein n=1 Tax=Alteraurantiacibacter aquimixticola TaxID=2489173 RepID=A0A4T3F103_9SPHN|nr:UrcA family protein [Alteraurantiacibacter aquimixticola]TIX50634.1 UrcA family protein [Alteraurantiacibacter aquimixticola]